MSPGAPKARWADQAGVLIPVYACMMLGLPVLWLGSAVGGALGLRIPGFAWIAVVPVVIFGAMFARRRAGWGTLRVLADPACRVHALFPPTFLKRYGQIRDEQFEPEAVYEPLPIPERWWEWVGIMVLMAGGFWLAALIPGVRGAHLSLGGMGAGGAAGMAALGVWRQTWYRMSPGRLDIMEFRPWSDRATRVRTYDLRTSALVLDMRWRRLVVKQQGKAVTVPLGGMWTVGRIGYLVLEAAVSSAPTPDLPADRLHD